jgi:ATP synthase protein I
MFRVHSKPIRKVLRWQLVATALLVVLFGYGTGAHGALSAFLGGLVSVIAALVFAFVTSRPKTTTVEDTLITAFKAEAAKVGTVVVLLWLVFATYAGLVASAFLATFIATVVIFSLAFFVRD